MKYLKKQLEGMTPYYSPCVKGIMMNANESPFNLEKFIIDEFKDKIDNVLFNRYPDMDNTLIIDSIAKAYNISSKNISVGVGSDELIDTLFKAVISQDDNVLIVDPSFSMYKEFCKIHLANPVIVDLDSDFNFDVCKIIGALNSNDIKMVILCNPNNPTGSMLDTLSIKKILNSTSALVLLDEAYIEFLGSGSIDLISEFDNLIVLRTFSKAYSMPSMRLGYAISCEDNINTINCLKPPYNLNTLTQILGSIIMDNKDCFVKNINHLIEQRDFMYNTLLNSNITIYKSYANFLWMKLNDKTIDELKKENIYIRYIKYKDVVYHRVSVSTHSDNVKFLKVVLDNA